MSAKRKIDVGCLLDSTAETPFRGLQEGTARRTAMVKVAIGNLKKAPSRPGNRRIDAE
jgi:hypothetical protein